MHPFTLLFVLLLGLSTAIELWLALRQVRAVRTHRNEVPAAFAHTITLSAHQRAADYTAAKTRFGMIEGLYGSVLLLAWTLGGGLNLVDTAWRSLALSQLATGVLVTMSVLLLVGLLELPASLYSTFRIEQRHGFNRTSPGVFFGDLAKQLVLVLLLGTPLLALVLWLINNAGPHWWLWVWLVWNGFSLFMLWAYPAFIAPLFNTFTPLGDEILRSRLENLLTRCGFAARSIFVMDGSRRSSHGNAYFTGLGRQKRIVLYDTLINSLSYDELEAVMAHELGHFRRHHVIKRLVLMAALSLIGLYVLAWLMNQGWFYTALGVQWPSAHAALILFMFVLPVFTFFIQPLIALLVRRHEYQADDFAAEHTRASYLIEALVKLYKENANTLTPDRLYSAFHDSHPPAPVRVAHLSTRMQGS